MIYSSNSNVVKHENMDNFRSRKRVQLTPNVRLLQLPPPSQTTALSQTSSPSLSSASALPLNVAPDLCPYEQMVQLTQQARLTPILAKQSSNDSSSTTSPKAYLWSPARPRCRGCGSGPPSIRATGAADTDPAPNLNASQCQLYHKQPLSSLSSAPALPRMWLRISVHTSDRCSSHSTKHD